MNRIQFHRPKHFNVPKVATLAAMESFAATFPEYQDGEDLSQAARESADWEKFQFDARANKLGSQFE